ncbi:MAG: glycoside hydrolase family 31 protein [Butyrivibrio sp.]|uniref:glycoside hydrolase family 31 protein n=1 Tax=Butyrivibrio sp. TaxID=28121 RepID=UPI001B0089D3|nr:TIM-barrel domain-containing protein [Butyrivibrio sp.]MBO6239609.1 glycoside hydrolase family 31 protein [Butyrivibrio sp.]
MQFFSNEDGKLVFRENGETLQIEPWGESSFRVRSVFLGDISDINYGLLEPENKITADIDVSKTDGSEGDADPGRRATITNGNITARCFVQPWGNALRISFYETKTGKLLLEEIPNGGALSLKARSFKRISGDNFRLKVRFSSDSCEKLYGMGQYQQERMNLKGCNLELAHRNSQASIPFVLSDKGYGFLWNNPAIGEVHFGLDTTEWVAEETKQLDYWITAGDTPQEIITNFTAVVGRAPMMPEYGLGYWQCKLRYYNEEQVLDIAREYHKRGVPVDVLVIDYYHWPRCGDWRFDTEYFPNPKKMIDELKSMGIECMVSFWPQVDIRSENYPEMKQQGLLVKSRSGVDVQMVFHGDNLFMDATNPRTRKYVWNKVKKNYADLGINTFWLDEAEPEFTGYDYENYQYFAGSVLETGNIYPREYARLFYEGQKENGQETIVNLIRCAWVGSQRYGALVWSGDIMSSWEDFRKQIVAGLQMGIAGIPWWTTDIGGFHGGEVDSEEFRELLIRWFQFGCFCPVMRMHGSRLPHSKIINKAGEEREVTGAANEIWSYGEKNYHIMKRFIEIRESMRDYIRSIMKEASETGKPVIRTLFFEFPQDERTWNITDEYMFGGNLLVAPICHKGQVKRNVYLPSGCNWINAFTGEKFAGGQDIAADAPIERLPVFYREDKELNFMF